MVVWSVASGIPAAHIMTVNASSAGISHSYTAASLSVSNYANEKK